MTVLGQKREYMGFPQGNERSNLEGVIPIDAVYLPTNFRRHEGDLVFLNGLRNIARNIYVISSRKTASDAQGVLRRFLNKETVLLDEYHDNHLNILESDSGNNPSKKITTGYDLPAKRNFAIQHAKVNGYKEIMLIDDDISIEHNDMYKALSLLRSCADMVGFYVLSYPDVSTIDHIKRMITSKPSEVSVGGNCLLFKVDNVRGFFPYVYNEDWLFIYVANQHLHTACAGNARQLTHEPWLDHDRIRFEQFGDIIASGIKCNLKSQLSPLSGTVKFWQSRLNEHVQVLEMLSAKSDTMPELNIAIQCALDEISTLCAKDLRHFAQCYKTEIENLQNEKIRN